MMGTTLSARSRIIAVFCGGFCGTILRALLSTGIQFYLGKAWPYDILLINVTGAFFLALFTTLADATALIGPTRRLFINVGFLGAYTTFSSLALGDILLFSGGQVFLAFLYLLCSFVGGMIAVMLGDWVGQQVVRQVRRSSVKTSQRLANVLLADGTMKGNHVDIQDDLISR